VKRFLCAVDLSDVSMDVLHYAQAIVQGHGGCLTVLHIVPTPGTAEIGGVTFRQPVGDVADGQSATAASSIRRELTEAR
jgi:universal stress protein family protein